MLLVATLLLIPLGISLSHIRAIRAPVPDPNIGSIDPLAQCRDRLRDCEENLEVCRADNDRLRKNYEECEEKLAVLREEKTNLRRTLDGHFADLMQERVLSSSLLSQVQRSTAIANNLYNINNELRGRVLRLEEEANERERSRESCGSRHSELKKKRKKELIDDEPVPLPQLDPIVEFL
jgi:septal ring factor EnvC (AmiA/AmiB activator)